MSSWVVVPGKSPVSSVGSLRVAVNFFSDGKGLGL